jgi:hypothetical protein
MLYCHEQVAEGGISSGDLSVIIEELIRSVSAGRSLRNVLVIPPDSTPGREKLRARSMLFSVIL